MLSILSNDLWLVSIYSRYKSAQRVLSGSHFFLLYLNYYNTYAHKESREFYDPSCKFESIDWKKEEKEKEEKNAALGNWARFIWNGNRGAECTTTNWPLGWLLRSRVVGTSHRQVLLPFNDSFERREIKAIHSTDGEKNPKTGQHANWFWLTFFFFFWVKGAYRAADVNCKRASVFHCVVCAGWLPLFFSFDRPLSKSCWAADLCPEKRRGFETSYGQTKEPREFSGRSV